MNVAQLDYIKMDTDFFDKPKIKGYAHRHGQTAISFLLRLLCAMGRATDGALSRDSWEALAADATLTPEQAEILVDYCIANGILSGSRNALTNSRVQDDQAQLAVKRAETRARVTAHRARKKAEIPVPQLVARREVARVVPTETEVRVVPEVRAVERPAVTTLATKHDDPNWQIAEEKLETPAEQDWTRDSRYISAGRRPMRQYPVIWLTVAELADVIKKLEESDIPLGQYKDLFLKAESKLRTWESQGRSLQGVSVYNWLTGFLFDELLERTIKETRLGKVMEGATQRYENRR